MDGFGICLVREGHQTKDPAIMIESIPSATYFVNPCDKCQIVLNNVSRYASLTLWRIYGEWAYECSSP